MPVGGTGLHAVHVAAVVVAFSHLCGQYHQDDLAQNHVHKVKEGEEEIEHEKGVGTQVVAVAIEVCVFPELAEGIDGGSRNGAPEQQGDAGLAVAQAMDGGGNQIAGGDQANGVDQAGPGVQHLSAGGEGCRVQAAGNAEADKQDAENGQFRKYEEPDGQIAGEVMACRGRCVHGGQRVRFI